MHCSIFTMPSVLCVFFVLFVFLCFFCLVDDPGAPQSGHVLRLHRQRRVWKDPEAEGRRVPCGCPLLRAERGTDRDLCRLHHWRQQVSYPLSSGESLYRFLRITHTHVHTHSHASLNTRTHCSLTGCSTPFLQSSLFIYLAGLDQHQAILIDC